MLADELRGLFLFESLTDAQVDELVSIGEVVPFADGTLLFHEGDPADCWWVLLEGRVELLRRTGHDVAVFSVMERPGVWAGGFRAWSDAAGYLSTGRGSGTGRVLRIPSADLGPRVRSWFPFSVHLIEGFFQTVRNMEAISRQSEKLVSLGTMAAGLAHEINNPASAVSRTVAALQDSCDALLSSLTRLAEASMTAEQFLALDQLRRDVAASPPVADAIALADREDALYAWLDEHDVATAWQLAPALATAGVDPDWCERVAEVLPAETLEAGLEWVASALVSSSLLGEVRESSGRISELVAAMKSYSQLDRASLQLVDVTEGIESTLVMLGHKLRTGIAVERSYAADMPRVEANAGELNQVWTNLIDNAIDAMDGSGTLRISTSVEPNALVVEIADTGTGMPPDVQARAFDAFFTTKDVGHGTGLGLDISRRIVVERHHGQIDIHSEPGDTRLTVRLPRT